MSSLEQRIKQVEDNISSVCLNCGRDPKTVKLVIVTKSTTIENIKKVVQLGYRDLGENRAQQLKKVSSQVAEFLESSKSASLKNTQIRWHMIGHLQRNKVKQSVSLSSLIQSVDTLRLAEEINTVAGKMGVSQRILLQVNTAQEPQKYGVPVGAVIHLAEQIVSMPNVKLCGLMMMAPLTRDENVIRGCFQRTQELFVEVKGEKIVKPEFTELSMGMSSDYQMAIEYGATIVRIGSAIFSGL